MHIGLIQRDHQLHRPVVGLVALGRIAWGCTAHHFAHGRRRQREARVPAVREGERLVQCVVVGRTRQARHELRHVQRD